MARKRRRRKPNSRNRARTNPAATPQHAHHPAPAATATATAPTTPTPTAPTIPLLPRLAQIHFKGISLQAVLATLILCALVVIAFFPATNAGLVWDDVILKKAMPVKDPGGLWEIWFVPDALRQYEGHYWPVLYTTFWLDHHLSGGSVLVFHCTNLAFHALVTIVLWRLLLCLGLPGAWFAAAVFAVHPLHAESVVWVIGRKDVLATLFYLLSTFCYIRYIQRPPVPTQPLWRKHWRYIAALILFVFSLLSKSVAVTLPGALLIWHWWQRERITPKDLARILPFVLLGIAIAFIDTWLIYKTRELITFDYSQLERALIAAHGLAFYLYKLLLPLNLAIIYHRWEVSLADWIGWGALILGAAALYLLWSYQKKIGRGALAGALFFIVTLSPTLGFVDYGYMQFAFVADRYQYLAGAGVTVTLCVALTIALKTFLAKLSHHPNRKTLTLATQSATTLTLLALLAVLSYLSWQHATLYRDNGVFFTHVLAHNPTARSAQHNYGNWLQEQGRYEEALAAYRTALRQRPDYANIHNRIGSVLQKLQRPEEAEQYYRSALKIKPHFKHAKNNLALLLTNRQQYDEALRLYREVIRNDPTYLNAHIGIGFVLVTQGRLQESLRAFDRALQIDPNSQQAQQYRAQIQKRIQHQQQLRRQAQPQQPPTPTPTQ